MRSSSVFLPLLVSTVALLSLNGCAVVMAAKQPDYKNVDLFKVGTPRGQLLGEFGQPITSETKSNGVRCDTFSFTQGYSGGAKAGRAFLHGIADVLTLGAWELIGTPTEAVFSGSTVGYQACYDQQDRIQEVTLLTPDNDGKGPKNVGPTSPEAGGSPLNPAPMIATNTPVDLSTKAKETIVMQNNASASPNTQPIISGTPQQKLQELKGLKKDGLITDTEYAQKKKDILNSM